MSEEKTFVTLKDIDESWDEGTNSEIDKLARQILSERIQETKRADEAEKWRDAFEKVALAEQFAHFAKDTGTLMNAENMAACLPDARKSIRDQARRILEGKESTDRRDGEK